LLKKKQLKEEEKEHGLLAAYQVGPVCQKKKN
jgi:hypothetical protein